MDVEKIKQDAIKGVHKGFLFGVSVYNPENELEMSFKSVSPNTNSLDTNRCCSYDEHLDLLSLTFILPEKGMREFIQYWMYSVKSGAMVILDRRDDFGNSVYKTKHIVDNIVDINVMGEVDGPSSLSKLIVTMATTMTIIVENDEKEVIACALKNSR